MLIGINGGYFPAICRVCLILKDSFREKEAVWSSEEKWLVSLFSHSAQSPFKQQLLNKAIQNEDSQYKKNQSQK